MDIVKIKEYYKPYSPVIKLNTPDKPYFVKTNNSIPIYHTERLEGLAFYLSLLSNYPFMPDENAIQIKLPSKSKYKNIFKYYTQTIKYDVKDTETINSYIILSTDDYKVLLKQDWEFPILDINDTDKYVIDNLTITPEVKQKFAIVEHSEFDAMMYVFLDFITITLDIIFYDTFNLDDLYVIMPIASGWKYEVLDVSYSVIGTYIKNATKVSIKAVVLEDV